MEKAKKPPGGGPKGNGKGGKATNSQPSLAQANKELLAKVAELEALVGKSADTPDEPKPAADTETAELQDKIKRLEPMVNAGKVLKPGDAGYETRLAIEEDLRATRQRLLELKPPGARLAAAKGTLKKKEAAWDKTKASRHACEKAVEHAQAELEQALAVEATAADAVAAAKKEVDTAQEANSPAAPPAKAEEQQTLLPLQARFEALLQEGGADADFVQSMRHRLLSPAAPPLSAPQTPGRSLAESVDDSDEEEMDEEDDIEEMLDRLAEPGETDDRRAQRRQDLEKAGKAKKEKSRTGKVAKKQLKAK